MSPCKNESCVVEDEAGEGVHDGSFGRFVRCTKTYSEEFPYLAEVVAGHVAKVGYDFTAAFEYGLDLILDALEKRRNTA